MGKLYKVNIIIEKDENGYYAYCPEWKDVKVKEIPLKKY